MIYVAKEITQPGEKGLQEITEGRILKTKCQREIKPEELFKCVEDMNETFDPRTVLLHGPPGIGKTTVCYKLLFDVTKDKLFADQKPIPYLIRLRDINTLNSDITFKELLLDKHGRKYGSGDNWISELWTQLEKVQDRIVVFIDGYDESDGLGANTNPEYLKTRSRQ